MASDEGVWRDVEIVRSAEGVYDLHVDGKSVRAEERKAERERLDDVICCLEIRYEEESADSFRERALRAIRVQP